MKQNLLNSILTYSKYVFYLTCLQVCTLQVLLATDIEAQKIESVRKIEINVDLKDATVEEAFNLVEKSTELKFSYDAKVLDKSQRITFQKKAYVAELLELISKIGKLHFKQINENIHVKKNQLSLQKKPNIEVMINDVVVSGKVTSDTGEALPGVNIIVKGTTVGTATDINGGYTLSVPDDSEVLIFSFIGYKTQEISIGSRAVIDVSLEADVQSLGEVVVIGYGTQKKSDLTGAVGSVDGDEISKFSAANATSAIQGRMAGVRVENDGGSPGANTFVTIRGAGTLSDGQPLYVIDGMVTGSMNNLNPEDIESVSVLKDASAAAIYGSRAGNGVVIVTTKKGKSGELSVDFNASIGTQKVVKTIDWANAAQYSSVIRQAIDNDNIRNLRDDPNAEVKPYFSAIDITQDGKFDSTIDSDIQDESLRSAPISTLGLRLSGGSDQATYSLSFGHLKQEGILKESAFERINIRANTSFTKGKFKLDQALALTRTINNPNPYFNGERDLIPIIPLRDSLGNFTAVRVDGAETGVNVGNSLGIATIEERENTSNQLLGNLNASFEIIEGLIYRSNLGLTLSHNNNFRFTPSYEFSASSTNGANSLAGLNERNSTGWSLLSEQTLTFKRSFGDHSIEALAGYSWQKNNNRFVSVQGNTFISEDVRVISQAGVLENAGSSDNTSFLISSFGRLNYSFDDRYSVTATIRRDASSLFQNFPYSVFPSFAAAWNISNESFMDGVSSISGLKIRASYGETGNNNARPYAADIPLNVDSDYPLGTGDQTRAPGVSITGVNNVNLKWETTVMTDIGLEVGILEDKVRLTVDYFNKESNDVIRTQGQAPWTGRSGSAPFNVASIINKGFEFGIDYSQKFGDLTLGVNANLTTIDNEVTEVGATPIDGGAFTSDGGRDATRTDVGRPVAYFYGFKVVGIYQTDADAIEDGRPLAGAGDLIFEDIDGVLGISDDDKQYLGSSIPNFEYGLNLTANYKGLDLTMFFNGVSGNKIANANIFRAWFEEDNNVFASMTNAWTPENPSTTVPRATLADLGRNGTSFSDFFLESGAYFRLRNIQLGYTIASSITEKAKLNKVRIYATAQNLFTITDYTGYYPEIGRGTRGGAQRIFNSGVDERAYPTAKTFQIGIQVGF